MTSLGGLGRGLRRRAGLLRSRLMPGRYAATPAPTARPGRAPEAALETTNLGPVLDRAVLNARRHVRLGEDPDYDLLYENFDVQHYLLQAPRLIERRGLDLVKHFLEHGVAQLHSPDIHFSMSTYLRRYPERADESERSPYLAWLKRGRAAGESADPAPGIPQMASVLGIERDDVEQHLVARRTDLVERLRTGELGEMVARAAELDPLVGRARTHFTRPKMLPFEHSWEVKQVAAIHAAHVAAEVRPARLVLVINRPRWGGGRRLEGHLAHALASRIPAEEVVVVYTDGEGTSPPGRLPAGVREIHFARIVAGMQADDAEVALANLLRSFHADAIVNLNSGMLHRAAASLGSALTASERLFLCFFCNEQTPDGGWNGWSLRYFYRLYDQVAGVITDSEFLSRQLEAIYRVGALPQSKLHVMRAPVDPSLPLVTAPAGAPGRRPQVFWAGRWDRQKRPELMLRVARLMPDVDFRMWGEAVMSAARKQAPPNVILEGRYDHFSELPLDQADVWLYTSAWDGVPSQLLEVAMTGIPIVGTLVGGTGEVLREEESWPVDEGGQAKEYVAAIRAVLADPPDSRRRARALRDRMLTERTVEAFTDQAAQLLLTDRVGETVRQ